MKTILVGVDGSLEARQAVDLACQIARPSGASLQLVYVLPPLALAAADASEVDLTDWEQVEEKYGTELLRDLASRCGEQGVTATTFVARGQRPAEQLAELAAAAGVEMVVVGHRGRGAASRRLLGSVADRLAQIATRPVLIVRGEPR